MHQDSSQTQIFSAIRNIAHRFDTYSKGLSKEHGLSLPQLAVLVHLEHFGQACVTSIARGVSLSPATVSGILDRLEKKGLITRKADKDDKRSKVAKLTAQGKKTVKASPPLIGGAFIESFEGLHEWEQSLILSALQRVGSLMEGEKGKTQLRKSGHPEKLETHSLSDGTAVHIMKAACFADLPKGAQKDELARFVMENLHPYEDTFEDTCRGIDDALAGDPCKGGFVLLAMQGDRLAGTLVMLETRMRGYIPEKCLLFVGVDQQMRGHGIGRLLIERAKKEAGGDIYLHVEYANVRAQKLYERLGFVNRYAEMRFYQSK